MPITPIDELDHRLPQIGRIRSGSMENKKSPVWIITGSRPDILDLLTPDYGGRVEQWDSQGRSPDTHRLVTETKVEQPLEVVLPPEPLSEPVYELWDGPTIRRRCDGRVCTGWPKDGSPAMDVDCLCQAVDDPPCKPMTHIRLMFPQTPIGVWRLSTKSRNAMIEVQQAIAVIRAAASVGFPRAHLVLDHRKSGGNKIRVPVLSSPASWVELEAAAAQAGHLIGNGAETRVELPAAKAPLALPAGAEVIDVDEEVEL